MKICGWCAKEFDIPNWALKKIESLENKNKAAWVCKDCAEKLRPIASKK